MGSIVLFAGLTVMFKEKGKNDGLYKEEVVDESNLSSNKLNLIITDIIRQSWKKHSLIVYGGLLFSILGVLSFGYKVMTREDEIRIIKENAK